MTVSLGWSEFAKKHSTWQAGNSYTSLSDDEVIRFVQKYWQFRRPGTGEANTDRKVLVPISESLLPIHDLEGLQPEQGFYCPPRVALQVGMKVETEIVARQEGEAPYLQHFITPEEAMKWGFKDIPAKKVDIVCYSADALLENDGKRSTDCDWEIVCLLCTNGEMEPMTPLTMARNFLEKAGGTKGVYSTTEFAEAIWYWSTQKGIQVRLPKQ